MQLTRVERWMLSNQFKILEELNPEADEAEHYRNCREVLEHGYELEYDLLAQHVSDEDQTLSAPDGSEVLAILAMYYQMQLGFDRLEDRTGIEARQVEFPGFDGNNEGPRVGYCRHVVATDRFTRLRRPDDFNSHWPTLDSYRRMLAVYTPLQKARSDQASFETLSKRELLEILAARAHPDSPAGKLAAAKPEGSVQ